jgi:hypothetical protein
VCIRKSCNVLFILIYALKLVFLYVFDSFYAFLTCTPSYAGFSNTCICSSEKIRPEKELERAKAEILRCKLRIREAFRNMDSLLSEGKIDESLFDSEGEISSEDVGLLILILTCLIFILSWLSL